MAKIKSPEAWARWLQSLSPQVRETLRTYGIPQAADTDTYVAWRATLSLEAQRAVDSLVAVSAPVDTSTDTDRVRFCAVESDDGDYSVLRVFRDAEGLVRRMQALEGKDMTFWPFYGVPLSFSRGPLRYLLLPDGATAISVPVEPGAPVHRVDVTLLNSFEVQDDCYLGPEEAEASADAVVSTTQPPPSQPPPPPPRPRTRPPSTSDDDEDDGEAGMPVE